MKTEDFERLKAVCEKEGYLIRNEDPWDGSTFVITKKDPWEGVEFVDNGQRIRKIKSIEKGLVFYEGGSFNHINDCKPSTEQAYVEQLKKEAFERFGDIKDGDRFDRTSINLSLFTGQIPYNQHFKGVGFKYFKINDSLEFAGIKIYQQGKWAERVKERVSGEYVRYHILWPNEDGATLGFSFKGFLNNEGLLPIKLENAGKFLASQLENYLNNEA